MRVTGKTGWESNNCCCPAGQDVGDRVLNGEVLLDTSQVLQVEGRFTRHTLKKVRSWRIHLKVHISGMLPASGNDKSL